MAIRFAIVADVPALVALGARMHALTRFRSLDYRPDRVARALSDVITQGRHKYVFLVATGADGRIVGGLLGVLEQHIFSDQLTASVVHFDVLPEARMGGHGVRLLWAAAGSMDTDLSFLRFLELYRTDVPERRVPARRVVEPLDVVEHV